jgi:hypothetical protein
MHREILLNILTLLILCLVVFRPSVFAVGAGDPDPGDVGDPGDPGNSGDPGDSGHPAPDTIYPVTQLLLDQARFQLSRQSVIWAPISQQRPSQVRRLSISPATYLPSSR